MCSTDSDRTYYRENWKVLLRNLLDWNDQEIMAWVDWADHVFDLADPNSMTYHEFPAYSVIPKIMRTYLGDNLSDEDVYQVQDAMRRVFDYGRPDFTQVTDWSFYKEQLACVLSDYSRKIKPARERRKELAAKA